MDKLFILILFCCFLAQSVLFVFLQTTKSVSLPLAQILNRSKKNKSLSHSTYGVTIFFLVFIVMSLVDLLSKKALIPSFNTFGNTNENLDVIKTYFIFLLGSSNLFAFSAILKFSELICSLHFSTINLEAMKRQVKGFQTEYERLSSTVDKKMDDKTVAESAATSNEAKVASDIAKLTARLEKAQNNCQILEEEVVVANQRLQNLGSQFDEVVEENKRFNRELTRHADGPLNQKKDN